jgi:multiple sugar transport system permease protein
MPDSSLGTMSTSLYRFKGPYGSDWPVICAGVILVIIPTLIAFLGLQKYIYNGFTAGAVKG